MEGIFDVVGEGVSAIAEGIGEVAGGVADYVTSPFNSLDLSDEIGDTFKSNGKKRCSDCAEKVIKCDDCPLKNNN